MVTSNQISIPGFSTEQISSLTTLIKNTIHEAFEKHFGPRLPQLATQLITQPATQLVTQPATQPVTQKVSPPAPPAPLQQTTQTPIEPVTQQAMEQEKKYSKPDNTKKAAEKNRARLYRTNPADLRRLRIGRQSTGNSKAAIQGFQLFFEASTLASLPGYIQSAEDMKATGQG